MKEQSLTKELAMGSILTGQISEIHLSNMRMYPFIFLDNVSEAEISYDIVTDPANAAPGKRSTVSYCLSFSSQPSAESLSLGKSNLEKALSVLFSQDIVVILRNEQGIDLLENHGRQ